MPAQSTHAEVARLEPLHDVGPSAHGPMRLCGRRGDERRAGCCTGPTGAATPAATTGAGAGEARLTVDAQPADQRIARLFEMTSDLLATISLDGRFTLLNPAWEQVLGWTREELDAKPDPRVHPSRRRRADARAAARPATTARRTSRTSPTAIATATAPGAGCCGARAATATTWYAAAKDVTDRMWLERQALRDPLTHLPNRLLLMDRARQALSRAAPQRRGGGAAVHRPRPLQGGQRQLRPRHRRPGC